MVMLTRWNPTDEASSLSQRMERLFDEMVGSGLWRSSQERPLRGSWVPAVSLLIHHFDLFKQGDENQIEYCDFK